MPHIRDNKFFVCECGHETTLDDKLDPYDRFEDIVFRCQCRRLIDISVGPLYSIDSIDLPVTRE